MLLKTSYGNSSRGNNQSSELDNPRNMSNAEQSGFPLNSSKLTHGSKGLENNVNFNRLVEISAQTGTGSGGVNGGAMN